MAQQQQQAGLQQYDAAIQQTLGQVAQVGQGGLLRVTHVIGAQQRDRIADARHGLLVAIGGNYHRVERIVTAMDAQVLHTSSRSTGHPRWRNLPELFMVEEYRERTVRLWRSTSVTG